MGYSYPMPKNATDSLARQRIVDTALDLFYRQGYIATGINQVIAEAKVSKNTFYYYFPSKEDLCLAYLQARHELWMGWLKECVEGKPSAYGRVMGVFDFLEEWLAGCDHRGCAFLNISSEIPDPGSRLRGVCVRHKDGLRAYLLDLLTDLRREDGRFGGIMPDSLADALYVLLEGVIASSQIYGDTALIPPVREIFARLLAD